MRQADSQADTLPLCRVFVGPNDLAFSILKPGECFSKPTAVGAAADGAKQWTAFARTPEVVALCEDVYRKARAVSMPFGMTSGSVEEARGWLAKGASLITFGSDFLFIRAGAKHLCEMPHTAPAAASIIR